MERQKIIGLLLISIPVVGIIYTFTGSAITRNADSAECKAIRESLTTSGAKFDGYAPSGDNVFYRHPDADDIVLMCYPRMLAVSINWNRGARPSARFFSLVGAAGNAMTGIGKGEIEVTARKCHALALSDPNEEFAELELAAAKITCQAFERDGGGVIININPKN